MAGGGGGSDGEKYMANETTWMFLGLAVFVILMVIYSYYGGYIVKPWIYLSWAKLQILNHTVGLSPLETEYLSFIQKAATGRIPASSLNTTNVWGAARTVGFHPVYWVMTLGAFGWMAWSVHRRYKANLVANDEMTLDSFIGFQSTYWTTSAIAHHLHPVGAPKNMQPQLQPLEWMLDRGIPEEFDGRSLSIDARESALSAFEKDLGPLWRGIDKAPTYVRALIAICVTQAADLKDKNPKSLKPKISRQLRDEIAPLYAANDHEAVAAEVEAKIAKYLSNPELMKKFEELSSKHAYLSTVVIRIFEWSKRGGVLASAEMLWIKKFDRPLWYVVNNVGRIAFHIEGAGAQSHFYYEMATDKAIMEAKVDNAVSGLEEYLSFIEYLATSSEDSNAIAKAAF